MFRCLDPIRRAMKNRMRAGHHPWFAHWGAGARDSRFWIPIAWKLRKFFKIRQGRRELGRIDSGHGKALLGWRGGAARSRCIQF